MNAPKRKQMSRRGGAMVLATITTGVASILAISVLNSSAIQAHCSSNAASIAQAEYLAETGVALSMHYLQYPDRFTGAKPDGFYPGESNVNLGASAPGTLATEVTLDKPNNCYEVTATALVSSNGSLQRTVTARVRTIPTGDRYFFPPRDSIATNADLTVDDKMVFGGAPVRTRGQLIVTSGGRIDSAAISDDITRSGTGEINGASKSHYQANSEAKAAETAQPTSSGDETVVSALFTPLFRPYVTAPPLPSDPQQIVPPPANVPDLRQYRYKNPVTGIVSNYNAVKLTAASYTNQTFNSTLLNPGAIFWTDQNISLEGVTINGTLLVVNGSTVRIRKNSPTNIIPKAGYPAFVSQGDIVPEDEAEVTFDGLTYARRVSATGATRGTFKVNGSLLLYDNGSSIQSDNYVGSIQVQYDAAKASIPGFGIVIADTDIKALKILEWTQN